jgi:predicted SPOUT superfamily RNA methylase MTH1
MLADEIGIAQLTKRPAVNKTSRFPDLPDAMPNLLPPQRSFPVSGEQAFLILLSVVNGVSRARVAHFGVVPNVPT